MSGERTNTCAERSGSGPALPGGGAGRGPRSKEASAGKRAKSAERGGWSVAGRWARLVPWGGSVVLHLGVGLLLAATAPAGRLVEEVTSGSWAGSLFEVGLSAGLDGSEGQPAVESGAEAASPPDPESVSPVVEETGGSERDEPSGESPREATSARPGPAQGWLEDSPREPSAEALGQTEPRSEARRQTSGRQASPSEPSDGARRQISERGGAPSPAGEAAGTSGGGAERTGLGGSEAPTRLGQLPAAWTRALPAAARGDATWHELEPGLVGRWLVLAQLDEAGALASLRVESGSRPYLDRLLRVSQALLRAGRFALPAGSSGEHRLGLEVWIDRAGEGPGEGEAHHVRQLASRYPTAEEPGEAIVVFNSGRRVQLRVFLEPRW